MVANSAEASARSDHDNKSSVAMNGSTRTTTSVTKRSASATNEGEPWPWLTVVACCSFGWKFHLSHGIGSPVVDLQPRDASTLVIARRLEVGSLDTSLATWLSSYLVR